jgi:hypothetical protein
VFALSPILKNRKKHTQKTSTESIRIEGKTQKQITTKQSKTKSNKK